MAKDAKHEPAETRRHESPQEEHRRAVEALENDRGAEHGAPLAPHQNRTPGEEHRGGPLPYQKK
ncbi:MAG TPA: hypothetical protein VFB22_05255 [Candidatus Baltobacteraceae bacterium]|nr:hypothetical protein [Candidatus Baltobacteraceae bacterium]